MDANELFRSADPKKGGLFSSSKKPILSTGPNYSLVAGEVNNLSRRLRILEERYLNLRKKSQLAEQNMISTNKKLGVKVKEAFDELGELRSELKKINEQIGIMNSELKDCANRNDLLTIDKYIGFWEPMQFLTEEEAKKLIEIHKTK